MEMTIDKCADMLMAKEKCMERETSGTDTDCNSYNCDNCVLCYEQGTMGEQKEALKFAVNTMRKYQQIQELMVGWNNFNSYEKMCVIYEVVEDGEID